MSAKTRRCGICGLPGHNRQTCLYQSNAAAQSIPQSYPANPKETLKKTSHVVVRTMARTELSPHLTNLRNIEREKALRTAPVFVETVRQVHTRQVVDIAEMIRDAQHARGRHSQKKQMRFEPSSLPNFSVSQKSAKIKRFWQRFLGNSSNQHPASFGAQSFIPDTIVPMRSRVEVAIIALVVLLLVVLPFPTISFYQKAKVTNGQVVQISTNAFLALQASTVAAFSADISQAEQELSKALELFGEADDMLEDHYGVLLTVASLLPVVGDEVSSRQALLEAGHELALGNAYLARGLRAMRESSSDSLTTNAAAFRAHMIGAMPRYTAALAALHHVKSSSLPVEFQTSFANFRDLFAAFVDDVEDIGTLSESLTTVFGHDSLRRYLIIFQNNHELRPTGGFMGSFAVLDVQKGKILNVEIPAGGTYDLQGQLTEYVEPPVPLLMANNRWEFQDANWFPDFEASAQKIQWFYEKSSGRTVDGVIAINASVLEDVLGVIGDIQAEEFGLTIASDNALESIQSHVESAEQRETGAPKAILGSLFTSLVKKGSSLDEVNTLKLLTVLHAALESKNIQVQINSPQDQARMQEFGWTGNILHTDPNQDYLFVVNTNINGQKTDAKIDQTIIHDSQVQEDGTVKNTVTITRSHNGKAGEQFYGTQNVDYIRVYVPEGASLISVQGASFPEEEGFTVPDEWSATDTDLLTKEQEVGFHNESGTRITREFGKTAFGNWVITKPGETSNITFVYQLPFRVQVKPARVQEKDWYKKIFPEDSYTDQHTLIVQSQSGIASTFFTTVTYPEGWLPVWRSSEKIAQHERGIMYEGILNRDIIIGAIMEYVKQKS